MRTWLLACVAAVAIGCGSEREGVADPLYGEWTGSATVTMTNGQPIPSWLDNSVLAFPSATVAIGLGDERGVGYLCGGGQGPRATVTGPAQLTLSSFACPPGGVHRDTVTVTVESGRGDVVDGVLTLTVDYVVTNEGESYSLTYVLVATRSCARDCSDLTGG
jgi:hypothetical protein